MPNNALISLFDEPLCVDIVIKKYHDIVNSDDYNQLYVAHLEEAEITQEKIDEILEASTPPKTGINSGIYYTEKFQTLSVEELIQLPPEEKVALCSKKNFLPIVSPDKFRVDELAYLQKKSTEVSQLFNNEKTDNLLEIDIKALDEKIGDTEEIKKEKASFKFNMVCNNLLSNLVSFASGFVIGNTAVKSFKYAVNLFTSSSKSFSDTLQEKQNLKNSTIKNSFIAGYNFLKTAAKNIIFDNINTPKKIFHSAFELFKLSYATKTAYTILTKNDNDRIRFLIPTLAAGVTWGVADEVLGFLSDYKKDITRATDDTLDYVIGKRHMDKELFLASKEKPKIDVKGLVA